MKGLKNAGEIEWTMVTPTNGRWEVQMGLKEELYYKTGCKCLSVTIAAFETSAEADAFREKLAWLLHNNEVVSYFS